MNRLGFIGLAKQNSELLDLNKELSQQLERVVVLKKEREEKEARANRKRLPKRQPISVTDPSSRKSELYLGKIKNCFLSANYSNYS